MASKPKNNGEREKAFDKERGGSGTVDSPEYTENEKEINKSESLPGWTIMRPLRKRGDKASAAATNADARANGNSTKAIADGDLKVTETSDTNDSGDRVGEVEALHDLRSDDELLGEADEEGQPRATRENSGDHNVQSNDGTAEERAVNGGGEFKVYKRRWFGLVQLVLLNIIVSWDASFSQPCASHFRFENVC
jgi:FLVCR family MFS transporter 7